MAETTEGRGGSRTDCEDYLKMYQHLRAESDKYHDVMWKLAFATVIAAAAVASFLLTKSDAAGFLGPRRSLVLLGTLAFAIGATGAALTHMYALYREVTNHIGNEYRNAWLRAETKPVLEKKLHARYELAVKTYKWNIGITLRWTFPSVVVALVGLVVAVAALSGCFPLRFS